MEGEDVGHLIKMRLSLECRGERPDWHCEKISVRNMKTGELYQFKCGNWLGPTKGQGRTVMDIPCIYRAEQQLECIFLNAIAIFKFIFLGANS